jgi:hypothetical protein
MNNNEQLLLNKLKYMNKKLTEKYKNIDTTITNDNTLFILDWDDTLFPTTWASKNRINLANNSTREQYVVHFQELDRALYNFLKTIMQYGKVIIVTNAMRDWIKISSIVIPQTSNLVKNINVLSARELFKSHTKNVMDWKKLTFQIIIKKEYKNKPLMNIFSIGDAEYEHKALVSLSGSNFDKIKYLKSFKLVNDPHHDMIIDQINVLNSSIPHLWKEHTQLCKTFKMHRKVGR